MHDPPIALQYTLLQNMLFYFLQTFHAALNALMAE